MMSKRHRSPQEKKSLSYDRDRRDLYGENAKASRRIVPLRKAHLNRAHRKAVTQTLAPASGPLDDGADLLESFEAAVRSLRRRKFGQFPAAPLREAVARKLLGRNRGPGP